MAWHEGLRVLVMSGEFGEGVAGRPPHTTGKTLSTGCRDASHCRQSCLSLQGLENQVSDFNVHSNSKRQNVGWVCLWCCRRDAKSDVLFDPSVWPPLIQFCEKDGLREKVMSFRSSAWLRWVRCLQFRVLKSSLFCKAASVLGSVFFILVRKTHFRKFYLWMRKVDLKMCMHVLGGKWCGGGDLWAGNHRAWGIVSC